MTVMINISVVFAALSALSFIVIYGMGLSGGQWWTNHIGRSLMIQSTVVTSSLVWTAVRRLIHYNQELPPGIAVATVIFFFVLGTAELQRTLSFFEEIRKKRLKNDHRVGEEEQKDDQPNQ